MPKIKNGRRAHRISWRAAFGAAALMLVSASVQGAPRGQGVPAPPVAHAKLDAGAVAAQPLRAPPATAASLEDEDEAQPPPGHPEMQATDAPSRSAQGMTPYEAPPDTEEERATLPPGTIVVELRDPENQPLRGETVTLGVLHQSVAKGESREHKTAPCDDHGAARFSGLEVGSGIAYRVTVAKDGATFAALPFQLPAAKGMSVVLHVFPVATDIQNALIVMQAIVFAELKDDRIQIEEAISVYNFGKVAWVPENVILKLPPEFTALTANQQMGDQGVEAVEREGAKLRGTFGPGRKDVEFRWQMPYAGEKEAEFDVGLPPHVAVMRVMALASQKMRLGVDGFPEPEKHTDAQGRRILVSEKQLGRSETPLSKVHVILRDLPAPGPARVVAACLAGFGVLLGIGLAFGQAKHGAASSLRGDPSGRATLLAELEDLQRARDQGEIGPATYERSRRQIIDAIARTLKVTPGKAPVTSVSSS